MDVDAMNVPFSPSNGEATLTPVQPEQQQQKQDDCDTNDNCAYSIVDRLRQRVADAQRLIDRKSTRLNSSHVD